MDLWEQLIKYVDKAGVVLILILVIIGGFKRWWVWGSFYDAKCRESEEWKSLALSTHLSNKRLERTAERAVGTMEQALQAKTSDTSTPNPES